VSKSDYLKGARDAALKSEYAESYFYSYDGLSDFEKAWQMSLTLGTKNIVYSTGISVCVHDAHNFKKHIVGSVAKKGYAGVGIWTVDSKSWFTTYMDYGATYILTNYPGYAVDFIGKDRIAKPGKALIPVDRELKFISPEDFQPPSEPIVVENAMGYSGEVKYW